MNELLKAIFSEFHNIAGVSGVLVSVAGLVSALSQKWLTDKFIRRKHKAIVEEAGRSFSVSIGRSYSPTATSDEKDTRSTSHGSSHGTSESWSKGTSSSNHGRNHAGAWNFQEIEPTPAERATKIAKDQVRARLAEAIEERERQASSGRWSRITSRVLTFGQYIIGALLTTSFAQNSLSKTYLSVFGLLVILCSATKQHFHVDENAQASSVRAQKLRSLVRFVQDQIVILEARSVDGQDRTDAFITLLSEITSNLSQIETSESVFRPVAAESNSTVPKA